jgi:putative flippase GtrA
MISVVRKAIIGFIDFFHRPFFGWINLQVYRYLVVGAFNIFFGTFLYYLFYNFIVRKADVHFGNFTITPHISAFWLSFSVAFPTAFALSKYIVFPGSNVKGGIQLFRYSLLVAMCGLLNYILIRIFVEVLGFYPTASYLVSNGLVAALSYIYQRNFNFRSEKTVPL